MRQGSWAGLLTVLGLLVALVLAVQTGLVQAIAERIFASQLGPATAAPGQAVTVPGGGEVPDLQVTVNDAVRVVPRSGPAPQGEQLWAAYVVVRNTGTTPHRPPAVYAPDLRATDGLSRAAADVEVRRGRSLDDETVLAPGAVAQGYVVWSLPRGTSPDRAVLRGAGGTVRWDLTVR